MTALGAIDQRLVLGVLTAMLRKRVPRDALPMIPSAEDLETLTGAFTRAARWFGRARLGLLPGEREALRSEGIGWPVVEKVDELGRVVIVLSAGLSMPVPAFESWLAECYRRGDTRERRAVLRALPLLPDRRRFVPLAVEACRSHVQPLFEAIACENPFAAEEFPERAFNQLVLKVLFTGVRLGRIIGLDGRLTDDLQWMVRDFISERRAAGRPVPEDAMAIIRAGGPCASRGEAAG
ncbi:EboA domain-containing protein [Candidatus Nitrospira bockiana]